MAMKLTKETNYELLKPVTFEGVEHKTITLRRPIVKDLRDISEENGIENMELMISRLSNWPPEGVEILDIADFAKLSAIVEDFVNPEMNDAVKLGNGRQAR
ncbi:phage tail assembly protein [Bartonella sp. B17]